MTTRRKLPDPHADNALALNDGQQKIGSVVRQGDEFFAFDINDNCLGVYDTLLEAARKIGRRS